MHTSRLIPASSFSRVSFIQLYNYFRKCQKSVKKKKRIFFADEKWGGKWGTQEGPYAVVGGPCPLGGILDATREENVDEEHDVEAFDLDDGGRVEIDERQDEEEGREGYPHPSLVGPRDDLPTELDGQQPRLHLPIA